MIYKTNESVIVIRAEAIKPIDTEVAFWSRDRGTAKLRFKLQKDGISQSLPEGTNVPIRLMFRSATAEGGYGKHDYLATIEDRVNGIVSITLEDNILGYVGTVEGSIYIDFPNDQSLDTAGRFSFSIKRSPIDDSTPELENYYFSGFEQINAQFVELIKKVDEAQQSITQAASTAETTINTTKTEATKTINEAVDKAKSDIEEVTSSATSTIKESAESAETTIQTAANEVTQAIKENNVYTKAEVDTNFVNLNEPQSVDGVKNFLDQPMFNGVNLAYENFGITLQGGQLGGVSIADGTILKWGKVYAYDNQRSKNNDLFTISEDTKTLTILKDCMLQFIGKFTCQTEHADHYAYLGMRVNGEKDWRVAGIAGNLNWRNDVGWIVVRGFKAGDNVTLVTGTNYKSDSVKAWGVDQVCIKEVIQAER